ncbi:DUF6481 family protein [Sphingomonas bacterium]|uniref:DUF6481 family protein n=1 Tax=Sphingomonas bacterium TaxID=1895847 RepID=UPI0015758DDB|nr:DUF6481 family protein [Sphingomonas bacterium]
MAGFKVPDFNERTAAARDAKQRALDQLRAKPAPDPAIVAERQAAREARDAAAAEKRISRQKAADDAKAARAQAAAAEAEAAAVAAAKVAAEKPADRPQPTAEELKAARDAKYAARKARKR